MSTRVRSTIGVVPYVTRFNLYTYVYNPSTLRDTRVTMYDVTPLFFLRTE